ncbi:MAG TPA: sulfur carrier protein ThiS [Vicinamibacteria bacterium]|nr:sulfur carrier protein ThiS [Vicinamibacteria bacterium]
MEGRHSGRRHQRLRSEPRSSDPQLSRDEQEGGEEVASSQSRGIRVRLNGEPHELSPGTSIQKLLEDLDLDAARVAVEWNRRILRRAEFQNAVVSDGDELEVVTFVGGG